MHMRAVVGVPGFTAVLALAALMPRTAEAQWLTSEPITLAGGRVTLGGEASATISSDTDEDGWFNYTDYEHNALRIWRVGVTADVRIASRVSVLADFRTENGDEVHPYGLYLRMRPWADRVFDIQIGRIPPTFGAFARRTYSAVDNLVIGYPLAYQYLMSLRTDAVPATADDLLRMRGNGWRSRFPVGSPVAAPGLPVITAFRWDTGIQMRWGSEPVEVSASVTTGTLSAPHVQDDNGGKQVSARLAWRPIVGLVLGASGARGPYLADSVAEVLSADAQRRDYVQQAFGFDAEYSRDYWLIRAEGILSGWRLPALRAPFIDRPVRASAISIEGRYKFWPGMFAAARYDHLDFSDVAGSAITRPWEVPVTRIEAGGGYYLQRNLVAKVTLQHNARDLGVQNVPPTRGALTGTLNVWAAQLQYWF